MLLLSVIYKGGQAMTQLENNTTALEAILATVNALPNAGSGGGEVSGYQVAVGTFNVSSVAETANAVAATITGLSFKPRVLIIQKASSVNIAASTTSKSKYYFCGYEQYADNEKYYQYMYYSGSSTSRARATSTSYYSVVINDDGFILKRGTGTGSVYINTGDYAYVAIE